MLINANAAKSLKLILSSEKNWNRIEAKPRNSEKAWTHGAPHHTILITLEILFLQMHPSLQRVQFEQFHMTYFHYIGQFYKTVLVHAV